MDAKKWSILIAGIDCFIGDSSRGILNPVLWPLARKCGASVTVLGLLVSTYSIGRVLVSTEIGRYADESIHRHKGALLISSALLLLGALLWSNVAYGGGLATLFIAQFVMGMGTGNLGVLRSYVAEQAVPQERTWQLALLSAFQYAGFAATPVVGALLYVAGSQIGGSMKYSFPAYLLMIFAAAILMSLYFWFLNLDDIETIVAIRTSMTTTPAPHAASSGAPQASQMGNSPDNELGTHDTANNGSSSLEFENAVVVATRARRSSNTMSMHLNEIVVDDFDGDGEVEEIDGRERRSSFLRRLSDGLGSTPRSGNHQDAVHNNLPEVHEPTARSSPKGSAGRTTSSSLPPVPEIEMTSMTANPMHIEETDVDRESVSAMASITSPTKQNSASPPGPVWASTVDKLQQMMKEWIAATFLYEASEENDLKEVFTLFVWLNFTTRGVTAIYESVGTTLLLDQYNLTELEAGGLVSLSGVVGTVNLLLFRDVWTKKFDDMTLMCGGLLLMLVAQLFIVNYGVEQPHALWQYAFSQSLVYAFGYPIGNSAVLGMFAILSKRERQGQRQGQFARMGSVSRILLPTVAAYMNQYLNPLSSFAVACVLMCASLLGVVFLFHKIMYFRYGNTSTLTDHEYRHQLLLPWQKVAIVVLTVFAVFAFSLSVL